jgi:hypothetical protein
MHSDNNTTKSQGPRTTRKGPQSAEGRQRCAQAKTVHGKETRAIRAQRSLISYQLRCKEDEMFDTGYLFGPRVKLHLNLTHRGCGQYLGLVYTVIPRLARYSMGLSEPRESLIRSLLYQLI